MQIHSVAEPQKVHKQQTDRKQFQLEECFS